MSPRRGGGRRHPLSVLRGQGHLLVSVFDDVPQSRHRPCADDEIAGVASPLERLRIVVRLHLETLAADRSLAHVIQIETATRGGS